MSSGSITASSPISRLPVEVLFNIFSQIEVFVASPTLPPQLHNQIISTTFEGLYQYETVLATKRQQLKVFALVCHTWRQLCQSLLFRSIILRKGYDRSSEEWMTIPSVGSVRLLMDTPYLGMHVRNLRIVCTGYLDTPGLGECPMDTLRELIGLIPHLKSLDVHVSGRLAMNLDLVVPLPTALHSWDTLSFGGFQYDKGTHLLHKLLTIAPAITSLVLGGNALADATDDLSLPPLDLLALKTLNIFNFGPTFPSTLDLINFFTP